MSEKVAGFNKLHDAPRVDKQAVLAEIVALLDEKQRKAVEHASPRWQIRYARVLAGIAGKTAALKVACAACVGFEDVESGVRACNSTQCPLHLHRPFQDDAATGDDEKQEG